MRVSLSGETVDCRDELAPAFFGRDASQRLVCAARIIPALYVHRYKYEKSFPVDFYCFARRDSESFYQEHFERDRWRVKL